MRVLDTDFCKSFVRLAESGTRRAWHERNGGNLSYRLRPDEVEAIRGELDFSRDYIDAGVEVLMLAGEFFMVTGSGKFFCDIERNTQDTCGIVEIDRTGTQYRIVWGFVNNGRPTSEFHSHLMCHQVKKIATGGQHRVIYHCHPDNTIAMTFVLPLTDEAFSRELWEMMTECPVIFPAGVGVVPWMVPGCGEIAVKTSEKMKTYDAVIWAHHGLLCSGADFGEAYGLAEIVEKSAEVFVKVRSMTDKKLQTITKDNLLELAKAFGLNIKKSFLI